MLRVALAALVERGLRDQENPESQLERPSSQQQLSTIPVPNDLYRICLHVQLLPPAQENLYLNSRDFSATSSVAN
ncbi:hypothetical protein G7K_2528-t1 [Saitoella complicata NRRL Y-17804]|uniref:Uncharacterized protein n=1 Tax=Saitoella complicata (strain BCRC 22490 / CBS 7301 / JCM 7358 / NBRC 10748 / NRRL Y-17804) TaxID=698492 RepID=A0A0E9NG23_SAICN|nr:hypothetical protein G7K_2528-t1 [Saitoella complicata NRRL Y-17804]